jgi:hypothetical protein
MQYVGFVLIGIAIVSLIAGFLQFSKARKILAAPFRKTGELASGAQPLGADGLGSCEGDIRAAQVLTAPCSGQPCIYYHLKVEREVEKSTLTENGTKTSKHWETVSDEKRSAPFQLDDGSGPIGVSIADSVDADLKQSYKGVPQAGGGAVGAAVGALLGSHHHRATEHILPAAGRLFAMGKVVGGQITKTDGMLGKLILSTKGRAGLVGSTKTIAIVAFVVGGLSIAGGIPLSILGEAPKSDLCPDELHDALAQTCKGKIDSDQGFTWTWVVSKPGTYEVSVKQPDVKHPIWAEVTLSDSGGKQLEKVAGVGKGADARIAINLAAGSYKINVHDTVKGYAEQFKKGGGLSFWVDIKSSTQAGASGAPVAAPTTSAPGATPTLPAAPVKAKAPTGAPIPAPAKPGPATAPPAKNK